MTFGCSFTKYHWPTWADIVLKQAEQHGFETDNWGYSGAGNLFIAIQVQHAIATGTLKPGDHAFICWSTFTREDRFVNNSWVLPGNIFNQRVYPQDWVEKYADLEFYALRDCSLINATQAALKGHGIKQTNFNMHRDEPYGSYVSALDHVRLRVDEITKTFNLKFDCKAILEVLGYPPPVTVQVAWSRTDPKNIYTDTHHHPASMLTYVKQELCQLGIPWLTNVNPQVEAWVHEWDNRIKTSPQPLQIADYPLPRAKNQQWGFW